MDGRPASEHHLDKHDLHDHSRWKHHRIHDVGAIKVVAATEELQALEKALSDAPDITIVEREYFSGDYRATNLVLEVPWDPDLVCRRYSEKRSWGKYLDRGIGEMRGDAGRFGRLTLGETTCKWWRSQQYYDEGGWKGTKALAGGGALMNQAIHNVDLLLWMMGPAKQVSGFTTTLAHERIEVEDTAVACLQFASGALGVIQATTSVYPGLPKTIAVHGDRGTVVVEQDDILRWEFTPERAEDKAVKERFAQRVGNS